MSSQPYQAFLPHNQTEEDTYTIAGGDVDGGVSANWYKTLLTNYIHFSDLLKLPNERNKKKNKNQIVRLIILLAS